MSKVMPKRKLKIKKNDKVIVIAGRSKGTVGQVLNVVNDESLFVSGVNIVNKCVKANPQKGIKGGIEKKEAIINISNVAIYNEQTKKADKIGYKFLEDGAKVRFFKSSGEVLDRVKSVKSK
jgi:large subunit ribosomal protein L24